MLEMKVLRNFSFDNRPNREFWVSLGVVCDDKVEKAKARERLGEAEDGVAAGGMHKVGSVLGHGVG